MTTRGSLGWMMLAAALAVPGFMFYSWRSHLNTSSKQQMSQRVRKRLPEGGSLFSGSPAENKLTNPIAQASMAEAGASSAPAPGAVAAAAAGFDKPSSESSGMALTAGAAAAAPEQAAQAVSTVAAPAQIPPGEAQAAPAAPQAAEAPPVLIARDPTLSPYDLVRLEEIAMELAIKQREVERPKRLKPREPPIEATIDLQGIVSTEAGNKAIVNGEIVGEGDLIGKVKVARITPQGVVFSYKKRKFTKTVQK